MTEMIFVNLPVAKLAVSQRFYEAVGFTRKGQFSDGTTACMVWSESIMVMLHTHAKWREFTDRPIPPRTSSEVMIALSCGSRETVDVISTAATDHGGIEDVNPVKDLGFMYNRSLADPDGHVWEAVWMNPAAFSSNDR